ncbi:MAG: phage terminase large subunit [Selenomonadaceae bacterium]
MSVLKELIGRKTHKPELDPIRNDYVKYCEHVHRGKWQPARHLMPVCDALQRVEAGTLKRLAIFMPPRHGKSQSATETFPSYFIGRQPDRRVIEVSYGKSFAQKFGNSNRRKLTDFGEELFGVTLDRTNNSKTNWQIAGDTGGMISVGLGGAITGEGADLLLVDDVVKNRKEADSETVRNAVWDEWTATLLTRLSPNGAIVLIMTRWHEDDLAGRVLNDAKENGEEWEIINLPAIAEEDDMLGRAPGEALWPERFGIDWLEKKKKAVGTRDWEALYQQHPRPMNAISMFKREWFQIVQDYPRKARAVRYWDLAATEAKPGKDPDWTAGGGVAELNGIYYIFDIRRTRSSPLGVEQLVKQTAETDGHRIRIHMEQEPGSSGVNTIDHYRREVLKGYSFYRDKKTSNKVERAQPLSAAAEAGNVKIVAGHWNKEFLDEIEVFPNGRPDDMVDVVSGGYTMLSSAKFGILDFYRAQAEKANKEDEHNNILSKIKDKLFSKGGG